MRVVFVTDRRDSHSLRFSKLLRQHFQNVEEVFIEPRGPSAVKGAIAEVVCHSWSHILKALDREPSVVVSGPLDTVSSRLIPVHQPHIGVSWATDVMVSGARDEHSLRTLQKTVLSLRRIVTDNTATENALIGLGVAPKSIVRFAWGPEVAHGQKRSRSSWGLPDGPKVGLFGRSLDPHYDPVGFIRALEWLRESDISATWCLIERGSLVEEIRGEVLSRGFGEDVVWLPPLSQTDFTALLPSLDCVVSTSVTDGTSVTVLEAMRAKVPVVATLSNGISEWVMNGVTGWTCPIGNPEALAISIADALNSSMSRRKLITGNASRLVESVAGWEKGAMALVEAVALEGGVLATGPQEANVNQVNVGQT